MDGDMDCDTEHAQQRVTVGGYSRLIDQGIASFIRLCWLHGISTVMSCECHVGGNVWVLLPAADAERLMRVVSGVDPVDQSPWVLTAQFDYLPPYAEEGALFVSVRFPPEQLPEVEERLQRSLSGGRVDAAPKEPYVHALLDDARIPVFDRMHFVLREVFLEERVLRLLAVKWAEYACNAARVTDGAPHGLLAVVRRYARGEVNHRELNRTRAALQRAARRVEWGRRAHAHHIAWAAAEATAVRETHLAPLEAADHAAMVVFLMAAGNPTDASVPSLSSLPEEALERARRSALDRWEEQLADVRRVLAGGHSDADLA